ncbi:MAG: aspartate--tRNA ligase [bacterium]|nr:aspartate--tRNA ligase [bacterium]
MTRIFIDTLHDHIEKEVLLKGWVDNRRDHGKLTFIDLRDVSGIVQMVALPQHSEAHEVAHTIRGEWVLAVTGIVHKRPERMINALQVNGDIEIEITHIEVLNEAQTPPFDVTSDGSDIDERLRLKYRYLDLRRPRMQKNIVAHNKIASYIRTYLEKERFTEIETPILTKSTPEGARDFLVPSRLHHGEFYALPQSPQQYKQLLMVAGFERYFQIARCFRDEDSRADRAFGEFTQVDIEMSFVTQEDILGLTEHMFTTMIKEIFPDKHITQSPWPRLSHKEAMETYGTDKPDVRKNKEDVNELAFAWTLDFPLFTEQSDTDYFHGSGSATFAPSHHMFTAPHPDDVELLHTDPTKVRGLQHDLVLNGFEVGGGSIRIHDPEIQQKVFDLIGFTPEQKEDFAHMLEAFTFGVPPHGGIAPGLDRLTMVIMGEQSLREVVAFPSDGSGNTAVMSAPSTVSDGQLRELGIEIKKK